jgi:hypothetical protein
MKTGMIPEICTGVYFPLSGKPQRGYYVVLDEIVLAGPFMRKRDARASLKGLFQRSLNRLRQTSSGRLGPRYSQTIESVLREQEKALTAAIDAAS